MPYVFGTSNDVLDNELWYKSGMATHGSAILYNTNHPQGTDLGIFKNINTVRFGCEHAEDVFIRDLKSSKIGLMVATPMVNTIVLNISKSPCSSTYGTSAKAKGCAEELIDFQNNAYTCPITGNEYVFKLIVIARGVYNQSAGSHDALDMMSAKGIQVTTDAHRKKNGDPKKKEYV